MNGSSRVRVLSIGLLLGASLLLAGCGKSREMSAAQACLDEFGRRVQQESPGRPFSGDLEALAAAYKAETADIGVISAQATMDTGQANEASQKFTCRIQFDPAKSDVPPQVLLLQFDY